MKFWTYKHDGKVGNNVFCNLFTACKAINQHDISSGTKSLTVDAIYAESEQEINQDTTLVTHSGDWGIRKTECKISRQPLYNYTIEDASHGGAYLNLEIKSVYNNVKRWYMTNMSEYLHENIYPLPLNIYQPDWDGVDIKHIQSIDKTKSVYANFTITNPYRIRVAEWAWKQFFIDCNFPKRYETQDVELDMPILRGDRMEMKDFLETLASYQFALAPTGNGMDTFRTWDCIMCNTVPIVQDKWMNRVFSRIWPMILVSRYEFVDLPKLMNDFFDKHGKIQYDQSLLLEENFETLLDRIQYESDGIRREYL